MRTYTATDLVQLPSLDSSSAMVLGKQLVTAAKAAPRLPAPLSKAHDGVAATLVVLRRANANRLPGSEENLSRHANEADRGIDGVCSAMFGWLQGWSKLPNAPEASVAQVLLLELFPTGLKFTQFAYKLEWAEIEAGLLRIEVGGLDAKLRQLGGATFLSHLRKAHKEYGEALGITGVLAVEEPSEKVRDALAGFLRALRNYVLKVAAYVDPEEPATEELAGLLLAPLQAWRAGAPAGPRDRPVEEASPEPTPEPAPTETSAPATP